MRTILIAGDSPVPGDLRAIVTRGSTSVDEHLASELAVDAARSLAALGADRILFWTTGPDPHIDRLAGRIAGAEAAARREVVIFVAAEGASVSPPPTLSPHEVFVWPRDIERLEMAFLTGG